MRHHSEMDNIMLQEKVVYTSHRGKLFTVLMLNVVLIIFQLLVIKYFGEDNVFIWLNYMAIGFLSYQIIKLIIFMKKNWKLINAVPKFKYEDPYGKIQFK